MSEDAPTFAELYTYNDPKEGCLYSIVKAWDIPKLYEAEEGGPVIGSKNPCMEITLPIKMPLDIPEDTVVMVSNVAFDNVAQRPRDGNIGLWTVDLLHGEKVYRKCRFWVAEWDEAFVRVK